MEGGAMAAAALTLTSQCAVFTTQNVWSKNPLLPNGLLLGQQTQEI